MTKLKAKEAPEAVPIADKPKRNQSPRLPKTKTKKNVEEKKIKLIVNLNKCSQNWKNIATTLPPKTAFKRQSLKQSAVKPPVANKEAKVEENEKVNEKKIWFEVDKIFLPTNEETKPNTEQSQAAETVLSAKLTKALALDCEMVGVGEAGKDSILARISVVNTSGECVYDKYVLPSETVTDYRTKVSGIRPEHLKKENAVPHSMVQKEISEMFNNRVLVGHALHNDLKVLFLSHPKKHIRDTQKCKVFRRMSRSIGSLCSLKNLAKLVLGTTIQEGEHSSVEDAKVAMRLYTTYKKEWEADLHNRQIKSKEEATLSLTSKETSSIIKDGEYKKNDIEILTGNENHKRYLQNKLKKRNSNTKKFLK